MFQYYTLDKNTIHYFDSLCPQGMLESMVDDHVILGAVDNTGDPSSSRPIGCISAKAGYGTTAIDWLFVEEEYRNQGCATALLEKIVNASFQNDEIDEVVIFLSGKDKQLETFLIHSDFTILPMDNCYQYDVKLGDMKDLSAYADKGNEHIAHLDDLLTMQLRTFEKSLEDYPAFHDLIELPIVTKNYSPESMVYIEKNEVAAAVFLTEANDGFTLKYMVSLPGKEIQALRLLAHLQKTLLKKYDSEIMIHFGTVNENSDKLCLELFKNHNGRQIKAAILLADDYTEETE